MRQACQVIESARAMSKADRLKQFTYLKVGINENMDKDSDLGTLFLLTGCLSLDWIC